MKLLESVLQLNEFVTKEANMYNELDTSAAELESLVLLFIQLTVLSSFLLTYANIPPQAELCRKYVN